MKILFTLILLVTVACENLSAQNVGVGITSPAYPLTVKSNANGNGVAQKNGPIEIGFVTDSNSGWLRTFSSHDLNFNVSQYLNSSNPILKITTLENVGIGLEYAYPSFLLDIRGRVRIKHHSSANQTAGLWFDGTTIATRSFIGMVDNNHIGLWGSGGIGWNFAMNVDNGNIGIGTSAPTAKLDVNGNLKLRSNNPKVGSILISADTDGNTTWQAPVAFRATGSPDGLPTTYIGGGNFSVWKQYFFSSSPDYNLGLHYNANTSEFVAPVDGIYHFNASILFQNENSTYGIGFFVKHSNGSSGDLATILGNNGGPLGSTLENVRAANNATIAADLKLDAGDKVTLEILRFDSGYTNGDDVINPDPRRTWFAGHLVSRL